MENKNTNILEGPDNSSGLIRQYLFFVLSNYKKIFSITLIIFLLMIYYTYSVSPEYKSSATIMIKEKLEILYDNGFWRK